VIEITAGRQGPARVKEHARSTKVKPLFFSRACGAVILAACGAEHTPPAGARGGLWGAGPESQGFWLLLRAATMSRPRARDAARRAGAVQGADDGPARTVRRAASQKVSMKVWEILGR